MGKPISTKCSCHKEFRSLRAAKRHLDSLDLDRDGIHFYTIPNSGKNPNLW